ncbi:MAG: hypothetical protein D4R73_02910 [Deltaproteobacteria bacterium]|nr:MAG: hypothetical protein D4R73_02910 [Deltaproteobacteria bacterium]
MRKKKLIKPVAQAFQPVLKKMSCPLIAEICLIGNCPAALILLLSVLNQGLLLRMREELCWML